MTDAALVAFTATAMLAVANWIAVAQHNKPLEYFAKPATMVALVIAAVSLDVTTPARRWAFVIGLVFSLLGDIFLMLPGDRFVPGVGAFFCAHLAYIVGFRIGDHSAFGLAAGAVLVLAFVLTIGMRILRAVREKAPEFGTPVSAYVAVISVMVAAAIATGAPLAIAGAVVFMASDTLIAWNRFVEPMPWAGVAIMVTYHAGQAMLVLSLAT